MRKAKPHATTDIVIADLVAKLTLHETLLVPCDKRLMEKQPEGQDSLRWSNTDSFTRLAPTSITAPLHRSQTHHASVRFGICHLQFYDCFDRCFHLRSGSTVRAVDGHARGLEAG